MKGSRVGTIEVLEPIAQGGMGEVYVGWDERLERKVALKVVRKDRLDEEARARLLREARILSSLEDPRICRLYDYVEGVENDWLVMELLDGRDLSQVDLASLPLGRRLRLAQELAEVLIETHGKGIVHRDLKPANLMLMPDGSLKVLDFGIARFETPEDELGEVGAFSGDGDRSVPKIETRVGRLLGTLLYMSPEQARGEKVGAAADLYAFGLLLRQLLTGEPPYPADLPSAVLLARLGRGERPDPSAGGRLGNGSMLRLVDELTHADPERRPRAAVAARRIAWKRDEPRRRRRRFLISAAVSLGLLALLLFTLDLRRSMRTALAAQIEAESARDEARELADFLVGLFDPAAAEAAGGETGEREPLTARDLLASGAASLDHELEGRPRLRSAVALTLGEVYESLGEYETSRELLEQSLRLRRLEPRRPLELAESLDAIGTSHRVAGNYEASVAAFEEALDLRLASLGELHPDVAESLNGLAIVKRRQGLFDEAEGLYLRSLAIREKTLGAEHPAVARSLNNLGLLYYYQGELEAAERMYRRTLAIKEKTLEPNHPSLAYSLNNLANLLTDFGRFDEAERLYRRNLEIWQEIAEPGHPATAVAFSNLGLLYEESGRFEESERYLLRAVELRSQAHGEGHPDVAFDLSNLGYLYVLSRRLDEARVALERALAVQKSSLPEDHPDLGLTLARLAALELAEKKTGSARPKAERALGIYRRTLGETDPGTGFVRYLLALCDLAGNDREAARARLAAALAANDEASPRPVRGEHNIRSLLELVEQTESFDAEVVSRLVTSGPD